MSSSRQTNARSLGDGFAAAMSDLTLHGEDTNPGRAADLRPQTPIGRMSHGEALHEIGRLESQLDHKETQIRELTQARETLTRRNHDAHMELVDVKAKLQMVQTDRDRLIQQLTTVNEALKARDMALSKMTDDMAKAQKTIKVQSDQIATPSASVKPPATPHRTPNPVYPGPPPSYHGHRDPPSFNYPNAPAAYPPPMPRQRSAQMPGGDPFQPPSMSRQSSAQQSAQDPFQTVPMTRQSSTQLSAHDQPAAMTRQSSTQLLAHDQPAAMTRQPSAPMLGRDAFLPAPTPRKPSVATPAQASFQAAQESFENGQLQSNSFNRGRDSAVARNTGYNAFGNHQIATVQDGDTFAINLNAQHTNLFRDVEQWARNYANVPDRASDEMMPRTLYETLKHLTNPSIVIHLISTGSTRHFSVAKLINSSLVNFPLRPLIVKGFSPEYDEKISDFRLQLGQVGLPIHIRRAFLVASAELVQEMTKAPGFNEWMEKVINDKVSNMWSFLEPLLAPGVAREEAWNDLTHIWREAVRIGLLQMTKASTFTLDFPPVGPNSRFNPSNMISRDPNFKQNPQALGQMGVCVSMAITPIVTETSFVTDAVIPKNLHYANVLLQLNGSQPRAFEPSLQATGLLRGAIFGGVGDMDLLLPQIFSLCKILIPEMDQQCIARYRLEQAKPGEGPAPAPLLGVSRDTTVVRIPLRSAKHHFGVSVSRGTRPYNEDTFQAGVIEVPAFARPRPLSLTRAPASSPLQAYREEQRKQQEQKEKGNADGEGTSAESASGDPQVFYFGVFDGHGGSDCSDYLRENLQDNIEDAATKYGLQSTLAIARQSSSQPQQEAKDTSPTPLALQEKLIRCWKENVGGYFRRFKPTAFSSDPAKPSIPTILTHAFLQTDLSFLLAQLRLSSQDTDAVRSDLPLNANDQLDSPSHFPSTSQHQKRPFKGGSTASVALISTPTPTPFWHPSTPSTLYTAHCGDTRILLSRVSDGKAVPLTTNHHPSSPTESERLRKWAASFVTDSFGEERMSGLANTRAFGDMSSKRMGVSAEPEIRHLELGPSEYAFMVLVSDGVTGSVGDQEIVDLVKESRTPEIGAREVVGFANEVSVEGDNATALVVRLGGWERRSEGGGGSMSTKEDREWRKKDAADPRGRRT
ncbi:protein phosphatase PTC6, partial [Lecanoromycetidae sp. Uapishka_2]